MAGLILVRHATPEVDPAVPSPDWGLTEAGRQDCVLLAHGLPNRLAATLLASPERKTAETAKVIAVRRRLAVEIAPGLAEVERPWIDGDAGYTAAAERYLSGEALAGWEARDRVLIRFAAAIDRAATLARGGDVVAVTHGLAPSIFLEARCGIEPVPFWRGLTMPDAWRLDLQSGALGRIFPVLAAREGPHAAD